MEKVALYKLEILFLKIIPMVLAGCFLANTILSYFGIETEVLSYIAGIGILPHDGTYKYQTYTLKPAVLDYDSIVNAIISKEYPNDKMQAVINNYLLDTSNEDTTKEFNDMQAFRKKAKDWAKDLLSYVKDNSLWAFFD